MNDSLILLLNGLMVFAVTIFASFSGGGSSLMIFPLLLLFAPGDYVSLFVVNKIAVLMMSLSSSNIHYKKNTFNFKLMILLIVTGILGTALGTYFLQYQFDEVLFKRILTVVIFLSAIYLMFSKEKESDGKHMRSLTPFVLFVFGIMFFIINIFNGIFGGTGILGNLLLFLYLRMSFIKSISYSVVSYTFIGMAQALYLVSTETFNPTLALIVLVFAFMGGIIGTKLQYIKGNVWVKRSATLMLFIIGIKMLF